MHALSGATLHPYPVAINTHSITDTHRHTDIAYAFVTDQEPEGTIASGESHDLRWLTQSEINRFSSLDVSSNTREIYLYVLDECLTAWQRVPTDTFVL